MVNLFQALVGRKARSIAGRSKDVTEMATEMDDTETFVEVEQQLADLSLIFTVIHHGCMGLPQELVDHLMDMLRDDLPALKTCSLTCKSMFASSRRLIYRTLRLILRDSCYQRRDPRDGGLCSLARLAEHGLLQYTRKVHINMPGNFTPEILQPSFHHFQSLDRVGTLIIEHHDNIIWANHHKACFAQFYPTLTSLTLRCPLGHYRLVLQFALQFPNLEDLCIEWHEERVGKSLTVPTLTDQSPPLNGHLRLAGVTTVAQWPVDFAKELPNGINFRSIELDDFFGGGAQQILTTCAHTLVDLTIASRDTGLRFVDLRYLNFTQLTLLRVLTFRVVLPQGSILRHGPLLRAVSTIASPVFRELVLELGGLPSHTNRSPSNYWGQWAETDRFLEERYAGCGDFKLVLRTGKLRDRETFQAHTEETFPLLAKRGCIHFETSEFVEKYWY